ncbi:MAG: hypothetical protein FVQ83_14145 [Chloroflexi bacterium]|nr:hypothetical protein [Chloroflexota bacterium]
MKTNPTQTKTWKTESLHIVFPFGGTLLRALIALGLILFALEGLARIRVTGNLIPVESLGLNHQHFDIKWTKLRQFVQEYGGVDVIIMGSSEVNVGIIPDELVKAIYDHTGQSLRIFNLGTEGFAVNINALIIDSIIKKFHPKLIVIGTEIREFSARTGIETTANISTRPWIRYINGDFNLEGWFIEHSQAFRYFLTYRNWTTIEFIAQHGITLRRLPNIWENGYDPDILISYDYWERPEPSNEDDRVKFEAYRDFEVDPQRLAALNLILMSGTQIVVVEMPVYPTLYDYFGNGYADYETYFSVVSETTLSSGNFFIPSFPIEEIPTNGWSNRTHLNRFGAPVFSSYLGEQLANIIISEGLSIGPNINEGTR